MICGSSRRGLLDFFFDGLSTAQGVGRRRTVPRPVYPVPGPCHQEGSAQEQSGAGPLHGHKVLIGPNQLGNADGHEGVQENEACA